MFKADARRRIRHWREFIENPTGFPDNPPKQDCWVWTGAVRSGQPRVSLSGKRENPRRVLFAYHHNLFEVATPRLRTHDCGNPLCVNPRHTAPVNKQEWHHMKKTVDRDVAPTHGQYLVAPPVDPFESITKEFNSVGVHPGMSIETVMGLTGLPRFAVEKWLPLYLESKQEAEKC